MKGITKQKSKLQQGKTLINCGLKKSKVVAGRKTYIREIDPHCRCSKKEAVGMEHTYGMAKILNNPLLSPQPKEKHEYYLRETAKWNSWIGESNECSLNIYLKKSGITTNKNKFYIYIYIHTHTHTHTHTSTWCPAISTDIPDPLLPPLPIVRCFRPVFRATSCMSTVCRF